jgi:hypothetical protein
MDPTDKPPEVASAATASQPAPATPSAPRPLAATALGTLVARVLLGAAGAGLLLGFFLPWVTLGRAAAVSGFGLLLTQGELVELLTGPYRMLLLAVPLLGAGLCVGALTGHRVATWLALLTALLVLGGGLYTLVRLFLSSTGLGMWIVVGSALLALAVGLLTLGRR